MNTTADLPGLESIVKPFTFKPEPYEYKVTALRECPTPDAMTLADTPERAAAYWRLHVPTHPYFNPEAECLVILILTARKRIKGHYLVSIGTLDTVLAHPREIFRLAIATGAASIIMVHNHPSGDPAPSEGDVKCTRDIIRAGELLKIELVDHIIMSPTSHVSLKAYGLFFT